MKKFFLILFVLAGVLIVDSSFSNSKEDIQKKAETKLQELRAQIASLKNDVKAGTGEVKKDLEEKLERLEQQQDEAEEKLQKLKKSSGKAWDEIEAGLSEALTKIKESVQKARDQLR